MERAARGRARRRRAGPAGRLILLPTATAGLRFVEAASGRTLRTLDPGAGISGTAAVNGDRVYVLSNAGELLALDLP